MEAFVKHTGLVAAIDRANIDTDAIIPKQFLKKVERSGFGKHLFHDWRYLDEDETKINTEFILNKPEFAGASILLARDNFGCGSSREHAPWALADYGFKVIIAVSFADIFYNNGLKNGILMVRLSPHQLDTLFNYANQGSGAKITADLQKQIVIDPDGNEYNFGIDGFSKECLLKGMDSIGFSEQFMDKILIYEESKQQEHPWLAHQENS